MSQIFPDLHDHDWVSDFTFVVDVTDLMNTNLQGKDMLAHDLYGKVEAPKLNCCSLWLCRNEEMKL